MSNMFKSLIKFGVFLEILSFISITTLLSIKAIFYDRLDISVYVFFFLLLHVIGSAMVKYGEYKEPVDSINLCSTKIKDLGKKQRVFLTLILLIFFMSFGKIFLKYIGLLQ